MSIKKLFLFAFLIFSVALFFPKTSRAASLQEMLTSENSILVKIQERIQYFFAFKVENKVQVLEKQVEKRLVMAQNYAEDGNNDRVSEVLQSYSEIKDKQNNLLGKIDDQEVLEATAEKTIEQQKTMEEIKLKVNEDTKQNVVQVQERVVNQVAKHVIDAGGSESGTEFLNKVEQVWAPGTGPGEGGVVVVGGELQYAPGTGPGEGGVVIEGGELRFAPGTSAGGPSGADIKTVEVKTGGGESNLAPGTTSGGGLAPGTTQGGGSTDTIDPGGIDPGESSDGETWLAP